MNHDKSEKNSFVALTRTLLMNGAVAFAGLATHAGEAAAQHMTGTKQHMSPADSNIPLRIYRGFSQNQLGIWDTVIHH